VRSGQTSPLKPRLVVSYSTCPSDRPTTFAKKPYCVTTHSPTLSCCSSCSGCPPRLQGLLPQMQTASCASMVSSFPLPPSLPPSAGFSLPLPSPASAVLLLPPPRRVLPRPRPLLFFIPRPLELRLPRFFPLQLPLPLLERPLPHLFPLKLGTQAAHATCHGLHVHAVQCIAGCPRQEVKHHAKPMIERHPYPQSGG
jgi:hypothetical protein